MAIVIVNTNYEGEVLEKLLTKASTGNELVQKGLIRLEPNVTKKFSLPRMKTGKMLQKRKEMPKQSDSKGDFKYDERVLIPQEFMAFTTFNPRTFEKVWRPYQPKGNLVFAELPPEGQNELLNEMAKVVNFELGGHFINGVFGDDDDHLFDGLLTRMLSDVDVIRVKTTETSMIKKMQAIRQATPEVLRNDPRFKYIMSVNDADQYDNELTSRDSKGANWTEKNAQRFKNTTIEALSQWPDGIIIGTVATMDIDTNTWGCVNLQDDMDVIQIDKLENAGELYFFKMLMTADTNTAFGEEVVLMDTRVNKAAKLTGTTVTLNAYSCVIEASPAADASWNITGEYAILGAHLKVVNKSADKKITIGDVVIGGGKSIDLYFDGKAWFTSDPEAENVADQVDVQHIDEEDGN
jgi:hypothetical protein|nr:MAG TPA: major capsid protein [Caudoviricetes sp.]